MTQHSNGVQPLCLKAWPGALAIGLVYLVSTGWGFWMQQIQNPDEPRYACAARDMVEGTGSWLIPTFNGEPRLNKPPLIYWALAVCGQVGRAVGLSTEAAFRLAPLLAGLVTVLSLYGLGRRLFNPRVGLFAGLMLVATPFVHDQWREIDTDPFLTAGLTASWYFLSVILTIDERNKGGTVWPYALAGYIAMGLACLAKGPFLLGIFLVSPVAAYLLWRRTGESSTVPQTTFRLGLWWGLPLTLLIGLGWNILLKGTDLPEARGQAHESLYRFLGGVDHNKGIHMYPWLQYFMNVPQQLLPWSLFLLPLLTVAWRECRDAFRCTLYALAALIGLSLILRVIGGPSPEDRWQFGPFLGIALGVIVWTILVCAVWVRRVGRLPDRAKLLICAVGIPFLIMGIVGSKRNSYLLPIFPFLVLWAAQAWDWVLVGDEAVGTPGAKGPTRAWKVLAGGLGAILPVFPLGLALVGVLGIQTKIGVHFPWTSVALCVVMVPVMVAGGVWSIRLLRAGRLNRAAVQVLLLAAAALFVHQAVLQSALDGRDDREAFYASVSETAGSRPLVWFGGTANEAVYYCRRQVDRLVRYSDMETRFFSVPDAVMVVRGKELDSKAEPSVALRASVHVLRQLTTSNGAYYVVEADPARGALPASLKAVREDAGEKPSTLPE